MLGQGNDIGVGSRSSKKPLIGVFLIVLAIAGYSFYTRPLANFNNEIQADISSKSAEVETLEAQVETLKKAKEEFNLSSEVERIESLKAIPLELNQDEVIDDLTEIAENYDITLHSISFGKGQVSEQGVGSLRISASFEGNYLDLTDFLEGLEQNARLFIVDSISVQVSQAEISNIERANFSLTIEAFFQN